MRPPAPRGRYAPSPTGELHLGNASTALLAWLSVRSRAGRFVLRQEDLDRGRSRPHFAAQILEDLRWLGLDWDEGPDVGGPYEPYEQSARQERYVAAFEQLRAAERLYPCFCSRGDIASAPSAPQAPGDEARYSGRCARLPPSDVRARLAAGHRHAWRLRVPAGIALRFEDGVRGEWIGNGQTIGDFVVWRSDGVPAYQLAVVVDDAAMAIDEVVRGDDLLDSTPRQLLLYEALALSPPRFAHVPLWRGEDGQRLSKRHAGVTLRELREAGRSADQIIGLLASGTGLRPRCEAIPAAALLPGFSLQAVRAATSGICIDLAAWQRTHG